MGKKSKIKREENKKFIKNLKSVLFLIIPLMFIFNRFIFYFLLSKNGIIFLHGLFLQNGNFLFKSGNYVIYSTSLVMIILLILIIKIPEWDSRTKTFFQIYAAITIFFLTATQSEIYTSLSTNELPWSIYFIVETIYELAAFYIIYLAFKNSNNKSHKSVKNKSKANKT